ncbi:RNA polymerase sigma-70 factor [Leeuwenhoekiella sp. MAR_2009_132]|uniref:RNA polymerase sigma-70 factor n=1 Tax=Leeuwenhoekiella sp. MAR_2009_132 TaxID=1392489 RepID=UPI00048AE54E|nr:RNA polymerase sigma-70 factor [Leeuwenhoekiella sp. MAR_2009_132]
MQAHLTSYTDLELQLLLNKDRHRAFNLIFDKYWKRLYTYAFKIYSEEEICEDIVQEVFVSLWEKSKNTPIINLEGYLLRAVKYKAITYLRNLKFKPQHEQVLRSIAIPAKSECLLEYNDFEALIDSEISKLAPRCKKVFILSRFEDYTNAEIAKKLNISIRTVEKHISDALKQLKASLSATELSLMVILMFQ